MLRKWRERRREAKMRSGEYARYYLRMFGDDAEAALAKRSKGRWIGSYRGLLYRYTARELRSLRRLAGRPRSDGAT